MVFLFRGQRRRATDPDAAPLRRVGWRLAALTVGLLFALLLALGSVVYETTSYVLLDALKTSLQHRAAPTLGRVYQGIDSFGDIPPLPGERGGVYLVIADQNMVIRAGAGPDGPTLADAQAAQQVLQSNSGNGLFSSQQVDADGPYLVYTAPLVRDDGTVIGVLQTTTSEHQYLDNLQLLLRVLLVVSGIGLLASALISGVLVQRALQPIRLSLRRQRDFVADAAHELRTPLTIMRTASELALTNGGTHEAQVALEQTMVQNAHLTRLVDSLSLLARTDSGVVSIERQPVDLGRIAGQAVEGIGLLAEEQGVALRLDGAGEVRVLGDAGRLRQLLLILLDNALKYTPSGGTIVVRVERAGGKARITVQDSGPGIDPADLPHLFDRFYRADRARTGEGMGLGLAIGRWIAEAHGGRISAANAPEGGAIFTAVLPLS